MASEYCTNEKKRTWFLGHDVCNGNWDKCVMRCVSESTNTVAIALHDAHCGMSYESKEIAYSANTQQRNSAIRSALNV